MELFTPIKINGLTVKNRMVKSATHETMAKEDGAVTPEVVRFYRRLAAGGVGLIITGNVFHHKAGHNWPFQLGLDSDGLIDGMKELTDAVHQEGGAVFAQINDCGREAMETYTGGIEPRGPSPVRHLVFLHKPREITKPEIKEVIESFATACGRAKKAGFDGIQIHGAHGYMVNQFLSPFANRRKDEYGGSLENRQRFLRELYAAVREEVGDDYPVTIKINATDAFPLPMGVRLEEALRTAEMLDDLGIDAIEVSCGCYESGMTMIRGPVPVRLALRTARELAALPSPIRGSLWLTQPVANRMFPFRENYNLEYGKQVKERVKVPVMTVGGVRDPAKMENIIASKAVDMVSLARPLICEPNLPKRIQEGDMTPAKCVNCNICLMHIQVEPLRCFHGKEPAPKKYF